MKLNRLIFPAILLTALVYFSCQKSGSDGPDPDPVNPGVENVAATVTGRVVDDQDLPVNGALVKAGNASTTTDLNGRFRLNNITLNKHAGLITVEKAGFFKGSRTITVNPGNNHFISIQLIKKNAAGNFAGSSGGTITVPNGGSISFDPGSVINPQNSSPYTGTVTVHAFFINPEAANFREIMPGALRGINTSGQEVGLQSFGMMAVELAGSGGEKLQLANGKPATITFPIPAALQSQAPATIPLWSFNDSSGYWKQEGTATKQGNVFVGKADHFSFWNCDAPFPIINFKATIKDQLSAPVVSARVVIRLTSDGVSTFGYGHTDTAGVVSGKIPANKTLELLIYNKCGDLLHTRTIGPFAAATDMGTISVNNSGAAAATFSGTVVNCTGNPVTNGLVTILLDSTYHRVAINNGNFSIQVPRCTSVPTLANLKALDLGSGQEGPGSSISVTSGAVNAGQLSACGNPLNRYITYTFNGSTYHLLPPVDTANGTRSGTRTNVGGYTLDQLRSFSLGFDGPAAAGLQTGVYIAINNSGNRYIQHGAFNVTVTEYGKVGGYIAGNFSAVIKDTSGTGTITHPINGSFRVSRNGQ